MIGNIIVIIIFILICCICTIINVFSHKDNIDINYIFSLVVIVVSSLLAGINIATNETNTVNPLDVYRNKTELQVTYKIVNNDTISCDSIVVFKNK